MIVFPGLFIGSKLRHNTLPVEEYDIKYMRRALELAAMAGGRTRPNPLVGAVIVHKEMIIGEGFHTMAGKPHAEVEAFMRVRDRSLTRECDIYVTLEPCSHYGKTPPCAEMIAREGFRRVIIGTMDTSAKVSGKGIEILRSSGCEVVTGILEDECRYINRRFFTHQERGRPYIILKWAMTADGFLDADRNPGMADGPNWITGMEERILVHKWRSEEHSVMIGENTLCNDNPSLDVRYWSGMDPVRIVISDSSDLDTGYRLFSDRGKTLVFTPHIGRSTETVEYIAIADREKALPQVLSELNRREIQSVLVEGGASLLKQFISARLWDEARVFTGKTLFGNGLTAPVPEGYHIDSIDFESSTLDIYAPEPIF